MFDLTGKTALITGATGTIGGAIARRLHGQGATVAISGTRVEVLDQLASELGGRVHVLPCDLADAAAIEALVPRAEELLGQLDVLVANAGVTRDNLLVQLRDEDWEQVIAINLNSTFRLTRAAVRGMMRRRFGRVIAITSVVGFTGNAGQSNYVAAKAGIAGMMLTMARDLGGLGIRSVAIAPSLFSTGLTESIPDEFAAVLTTDAAFPKRMGRPEEYGKLVLAIVENAMLNGLCIRLDGGQRFAPK